MIDHRGRLLVAAPGFAGLPMPSYERALEEAASAIRHGVGPAGSARVGSVRKAVRKARRKTSFLAISARRRVNLDARRVAAAAVAVDDVGLGPIDAQTGLAFAVAHAELDGGRELVRGQVAIRIGLQPSQTPA